MSLLFSPQERRVCGHGKHWELLLVPFDVWCDNLEGNERVWGCMVLLCITVKVCSEEGLEHHHRTSVKSMLMALAHMHSQSVVCDEWLKLQGISLFSSGISLRNFSMVIFTNISKQDLIQCCTLRSQKVYAQTTVHYTAFSFQKMQSFYDGLWSCFDGGLNLWKKNQFPCRHFPWLQ